MVGGEAQFVEVRHRGWSDRRDLLGGQRGDRRRSANDLDIVVSHSDNGGRRWSRPVVALDGDPSSVTFDPETGEEVEVELGFDFDKPWIATHVAAKGQSQQLSRRVYMSATRFDAFNPGLPAPSSSPARPIEPRAGGSR